RHGRVRAVPRRHRQAGPEVLLVGRPLRARALHQGRGRAAAGADQRRRGRGRAGARRRSRAGHGSLQPRRRARLRGAVMTALWKEVIASEARLARWVERGGGELNVARLPRPAWPIVAGSIARGLAARGRQLLILVPGPDRFAREPLVEQHGQFSLRGGILDVFPAAADAPVRAEWSGDAVETLRLFDPENQRSVMAIPDAVIRTGRELLIGPDRGAAAVERLHGTVSLDTLRGDVLSEWEDELTRLGAGAAFAGVEFYAAYLDPSRPSLLDHVPPDAVILDF